MLAERWEMTTTQRTSIRRRLAVRRTAHRPPRRGRKGGHGSIVAPLAATIAATVAVGVGVALARAERDRRAARTKRSRERRFALLGDERLADGLRRMALGQLDLAIELLEGAGGAMGADVAVHETRKSLKRLRALMRLLEDELGEQAYARESALLRDAGRRLAGARDAEVLVNTLDDLLGRHPGKLAHRRGVARLRARLAAERDRAAEMTLGETATRVQVVDDLRAARARVAGWSLSDRDGIQGVEPAMKRVYRDGRRRHRRAARRSGDRARAMHEWRKRVKDLRYAAEMLDRSGDEGPHGPRRRRGGGSRKKSKRRREAAYIHRLARRADELGELIGAEHDLVLLSARVREEAQGARGADAAGREEAQGARGADAAGRPTRKILLKLIARRRKRLRKQALRRGRRLYRRRPKEFVGRVRRAYARASSA
jgi:hypothetical protein